MSEWKHEELRKVSKKIGDGLHGTPKYRTGTNYYFINGNNLKNGKIDISENTKEVDISEVQKYYIDLDDYSLLMGINGTIGNLAFYRGESILLGKSSAYIAFDSDINKFYYYYFQLKGIKKYFYEVATGSTIKNLSLKSLQTMRVPVPSKSEYKNIVNVLERLDQKIALNNQINEELEVMAKTLYDYWFVQFDFPDENGKPYKSSGGKMVYNDQLKREIPEGWGVKQLGEIETNIVTGKTPSRSIPENFGGDIPFITIGDIRANTFIYSSAETLSDLGVDGQRKKFLPPNSLCVSCIATIGEIGFTTQLSQTNQQINSIIFNDVNHMYFLYFTLKLFFESSKTKTGNTFANMSKDDFSNILITYPESSIIKNYYEKVKSMFDKIKCLQLQNQELTQLRDWLLPMLMNGQVRVEE
ncbi:restriction endonuclease subunit S [Streptococcus suis]|uniref:restriction endonuclease subunit S n=1 Tax=Streptococcus suis TaxID=1307 RepID=UPI00209AEF72|nr:restriction endonuclease subunit S [Streptococcus suis]MCO8229936.1 restriction endonuclease subunit S [Streptococcus suis]HEM3550636.1 restriction endonuclease subunit S [Streptococcus suis]